MFAGARGMPENLMFVQVLQVRVETNCLFFVGVAGAGGHPVAQVP